MSRTIILFCYHQGATPIASLAYGTLARTSVKARRTPTIQASYT
ncbi:hypothetical protein [Nostoc sp.]